MAGIGFRLQKLLKGEDYTSAVKAFAFSTVITAGPFLLTISLVLFIQFLSLGNISARSMAYLQSLITYCYAFSLITVGASYLTLTRCVADEFYRGHVTSFSATFFSAYTRNLLLWTPLVFWFFSGLGVDWGMRLAAVALYGLAVGMWLALIVLSAAQNYWFVSRAFFGGLFISLPCAYFLGAQHGLPGYFVGLVLGQAVILAALIGAILREFGYWEPVDHNWLTYFSVHPRLAGIGFLYNLGIWVDKFLFWLSPYGEWLDGRLRYSPMYDTPMFMAYITVLPSMVYFFLLMETDFFIKYKAYYTAIQGQEGMAVLEGRRMRIVDSIRFNVRRVFIIQGIVTAVCLLAAPRIIDAFGMTPLHLSVMRVGMFSAYIQAAMLILVNMLLYFDHQEEALRVTALFCLLNGVLTEATLRLGFFSFGYGFGIAGLAAMGLALYYLNERVGLLHFWTFMRQPFPEPVVIEEDVA